MPENPDQTDLVSCGAAKTRTKGARFVCGGLGAPVFGRREENLPLTVRVLVACLKTRSILYGFSGVRWSSEQVNTSVTCGFSTAWAYPRVLVPKNPYSIGLVLARAAKIRTLSV